MKTALITGVNGQDGALLASQLIESGYTVTGTFRRGSDVKGGRLNALKIADRITLAPLEITDSSNVMSVLLEHKPDLVFNLAAQSFVQDSFRHPVLTTQINYLGPLNFLESIRLLKLDTVFFQASSSEIFGNSVNEVQNEETPLKPLNPYAISKCAAHQLVGSYRQAYGVNASSGILFNHESELRGREFVTRKIASQLAEMALGRIAPIELGNLDACRDWGYARDYTQGMKLVAESTKCGDYVFATNTTTSVRDFFTACARAAGFNPKFEGDGLNEHCFDFDSGKILCRVNKNYFRPVDVLTPRGDGRKMLETFGWKPSTSIEAMAELMVQYDLNLMRRNQGKLAV